MNETDRAGTPWRRRAFLRTVSVWIGLPASRLIAAARAALPNRTEAAAIARGRKLGIGTAHLVGPSRATANTYQTWRLIYTVGRAGMARGGGLRIALRHLQRRSAEMQADKPAAANYVSARTSSGAPVQVDIPNGWKTFMTQYFPWQNIVQVTLPDQAMTPAQTVTVTLGDRSAGGPGMRVQPFDETDYRFKCFVDALGDGNYLPLADSPSVEVVADRVERLQVVVPSRAVAGLGTWCVVRAEDRYGNPATAYRGRVRLSAAEGGAVSSDDVEFVASDRGVKRIEDFRFPRSGVYVIEANDGKHKARSNPVLVTDTAPELRLLWGDLHGHTLFSDGRGTVEQYYDYARRVAALDFCAVSDHAFQLVDEMWRHSKAVTNRLNQPGRFVTFNAYEWSGPNKVGGDHNVYFLDDDPPLFRSSLMYDARNLQMDHTGPKVEHVTELFARLSALLTDKNVLCIPHFGGRPANPRWHDPRVQRLIEVFSDHRRSRQWADSFLQAGHRLGIMAATDNHFGNPGYGYLKILHDWKRQEIGTSLMAVYCRDHTRESIFRALYDRRTYATSGARIILQFQIEGEPMGSEIRVDSEPTIYVSAIGTAPIRHVEITGNGRIVHRVSRCGTEIQLRRRLPAPERNRSRYYYVRVLQTDGEEAVSSPIWVTGKSAD